MDGVEGRQMCNKKCGIINYWWCNDNGAILTAYALQSLLNELGFLNELINMAPESNYNRTDGISMQFEKKFFSSTKPLYSKHDYKNLNKYFDIFIVGSDQVFRGEWVSNKWFLDFVKLSKRKIAMSASFGIGNLSVDRHREREIKYLLNRFNDISIREKSGVELCKSMNITASYVIDPVFLVDSKYYLKIFQNEKNVNKSNKHIFGYFRDKTDAKIEQINMIAKEFDLKIFIADDSTSVENFLKMLYTSQMVLTDSYHGLCFSLIFNKKYACYYNSLRGNDRFETLIEVLGIDEKKFVEESDSASVIRAINISEDWDGINQKIEEQKKKGVEWLKNALTCPTEINKKKLKDAFWNQKIGNLGYNFKKFIFHNIISQKGYLCLIRIIKMIKHKLKY